MGTGNYVLRPDTGLALKIRAGYLGVFKLLGMSLAHGVTQPRHACCFPEPVSTIDSDTCQCSRAMGSRLTFLCKQWLCGSGSGYRQP